jgi:hypothetical protein
VPPAKGIPFPPYTPPKAPLNLSPLGAGFKAMSFIGAAAAVVDLIGQAGAYKWRDNLLDQINGGNSNLTEGNPPFTGGQSDGVLYRVQGTDIVTNASPNSFDVTVMGKIGVPEIQNGLWGVPYRSGTQFYIRGGANWYGLGQDVIGINITSITRADGSPDTGGDLAGNLSGGANPNPFNPPATEPPPEIPPSAPPVSPPEIPPPSAPPSAPPLAPPEIPPSSPPLAPPLSPPNPLAPPLAPPSSPPLAPPSSPPLAPPKSPDLSELNNKLEEINKNLAKLKQQSEELNQQNRLRKKQDCCEPEFVSISVKKFSKCEDGAPVFTTVNVSVLKGTEQANIKMFESVANTEALQCKSCDAVVTFPDSWAGKVPDERPQAVVYYREWNGSKFGAYTHSVHIPHYSKPKGFKPSLPIIKKGEFFGILKFRDNSQIYVNCESITEAKRVISALRQFSGIAAKGARGKYGEYGDGDLKRVTTKAVRLDFYSKGRSQGFVDWSVEL